MSAWHSNKLLKLLGLSNNTRYKSRAQTGGILQISYFISITAPWEFGWGTTKKTAYKTEYKKEDEDFLIYLLHANNCQERWVLLTYILHKCSSFFITLQLNILTAFKSDEQLFATNNDLLGWFSIFAL